MPWCTGDVAVKHVRWVMGATANPMGQQHYEGEIQRAIAELADPDWALCTLSLTSLRNTIDGARRYPAKLAWRLGASPAEWLGRMAYGRADLVHRFDLRLPPYRGPEVVTAHDLPPARFDDEGSLPRHLRASTRRALGVITPSKWAAEELRDLLGVERVWVIPYGLTSAFVDPEPATDEDLATLGIRGPFVMHAAGATKRKNITGLAGAWRELSGRCPDVSLALFGPAHPARDAAFEGMDRVVLPGRVPSSTIARIMCRASAVVVPSTYEGFGLPALEGMACGAPVVAANRAALPEVCADGALLVEPDAAALAEGIRRVLEDQALAAALRERGERRANSFSWEQAGRAHLAAYGEALA